MSDSQKSVLNLELCGEKLRKARREPLNAKYPPCFKEYREKLFFKRGAAETRIYEVFAPNVFNHEPYEYQRIDPGVYNVENSHWALLLEKSHVVVSFVWKVGPSKDDTRKLNVTGGKCLVHVDRQIRPPRPDILSDLEDAMDKAELNPAAPEAPKTPKPLEIPAGLGRPKAVGITSLSVANIQKVGNWLCEYTGCHHVLWNYRTEFIQAFLYLILDNPSIQCGLHLLKLETDVFYYDPACIDYTKEELLESLSASSSSCRHSKSLEDHELKHGELKECDTILNERIMPCFEDIYKSIEEERLRRKFYWESRGMGLCNLL